MDNYLGEIRLFAGDFAPVDWLFCDGSALPISGYEALYTLIGTTYGGDGVSNFALPDLRGRVPVHNGNGQGLAPVVLGQRAGTETVTLAAGNLPGHNHTLNCLSVPGKTTNPTGQMMATAAPTTETGTAYNAYVPMATLQPALIAMGDKSVTAAGSSQPVSIMQPFVVVSYIIATAGIYPSQG